VASDAAALAATDIPLFFLALPHGAAAEFAKALVGSGKRVIDLSADFRVTDLAAYEKYYGKHAAPELLPGRPLRAARGDAPDWQEGARIVASPGCYPTSVLIPLVPLLKDGVVSREHIVVNSLSGVSGAGRKVDEAYLFVERTESAKAYGLVKHRHLSEIEEQLALHTGAPTIIQFNPHLAPMRYGIATTITVPAAQRGRPSSRSTPPGRQSTPPRPSCSSWPPARRRTRRTSSGRTGSTCPRCTTRGPATSSSPRPRTTWSRGRPARPSRR
jgi:N-acetyl-gamma-glutamyl-phosphate reductase